MGYLLFDPVCYLEVGALNMIPVIEYESFWLGFFQGGLHQVSWFVLLPEGESLSLNSTRFVDLSSSTLSF